MFRGGELQSTDDQSGMLFAVIAKELLEPPQRLRRDRWVPRGQEDSAPARGAAHTERIAAE